MIIGKYGFELKVSNVYHYLLSNMYYILIYHLIDHYNIIG